MNYKPALSVLAMAGIALTACSPNDDQIYEEGYSEEKVMPEEAGGTGVGEDVDLEVNQK